MTTAAPRFDYIVYDGTNGDAVVSFVTPKCSEPVTKSSESGGVLVLECQDSSGDQVQLSFNTGDRVGVLPGQWWPDAYTQAFIDANYVTVVP